MRKLILVGFALLFTSSYVDAQALQTPCAVISPDKNDGVLVAPENHHVLFENEDVRVIEVTQAPHAKETMHTHARYWPAFCCSCLPGQRLAL